LGVLDLAIVAAYLAVVIAAGAWFARRQKTTRQYFTGGGQVPWWAVSASIVATETSTVTFLSVPGIAYARGGNWTFLQLALGYVLGRIVVSVAFIPLYFKGELLTVYELLTSRFGQGVKGMLAGLFVVMRTGADGVRLLLTATVLAAVWRAFDPGADSDRVTVAASVALGAVMILFTLWGGMEAVIWIEFAQLCVYILGAAAAAFLLTQDLTARGGGGVSALAEEYGKTRFWNAAWTFDKSAGHTIFSGLVGGCFLNMSTHGTDQYLVQRYLCVSSPRKAAAALLTSGVVVFAQFVLFLYIGLLLFAYYAPYGSADYATGPAAAPFVKGDEVFTDYVTKHLPSGAGGLVVAAILAAALSSSLNSIAATAVNDLWRPWAKPADDAAWLRRSKGLTAAAGLCQVAVAVAARRSNQSALDNVLAVAGLANGPVLGIFLLGFLVPRAGRAAALAGLTAGIAAAVAVWQGTNVFWPWYTATGAVATLAAGSLASLVLEPPKPKP
jgi:SSS family transporter